MALATTAPEPTAGLVFYDLKTLLRQLDGAPEPAASASAEADDAAPEPAEPAAAPKDGKDA